ncbi:hypothetical protein FE634_09400 [Nocardioides dongxiaopingii]|uniref:hypothetical protein n=1 Tax=Nocardioides TaxID=1839 RepID=UPI0010C76EA6|nr:MULTISPECIES: hypothetical protein [Nocardioides]QCW50574.1 hypothetical protein FE634_09400 [Nocardioides sp. S-1144]
MAPPAPNPLVLAHLALTALLPVAGLVVVLENRLTDDVTTTSALDPGRVQLAATFFWLASAALLVAAVAGAVRGSRRPHGLALVSGLTVVCALLARDRVARPGTATVDLVAVWVAIGTSLLVLVVLAFRHGRSVPGGRDDGGRDDAPPTARSTGRRSGTDPGD